jgi:hypothetical protein
MKTRAFVRQSRWLSSALAAGRVPAILGVFPVEKPAESAALNSVAAVCVASRFGADEGWGTSASGDGGATALRGGVWNYSFTRWACSVRLSLPDRSLFTRPERFRLRVRGEAQAHPVRVTFHTHFMSFHKTVGEFTGSGEQELVFGAPPCGGWEGSGGENDGRIRGPLRLGSISLEANGRTHAGALELVTVATPLPLLPSALPFAEATFELDVPSQAEAPVKACWLAPIAGRPDARLQPESPFGMGGCLCRFNGQDQEDVARRASDAGVKWSRRGIPRPTRRWRSRSAPGACASSTPSANRLNAKPGRSPACRARSAVAPQGWRAALRHVRAVLSGPRHFRTSHPP